ncbi:hypothetical protein D3C71_89440 [compost metagenome]
MIINYRNFTRLFSLLGLLLFSKISNCQNVGHFDNLGVYRFNTYSEMVDSIFSYVENTSTNGTYVLAFVTKKNCISNRSKPFIKQLYSSYELTTLNKKLLKSRKVSKRQVKRYKLIEVSKEKLKHLQDLSYPDFINKYVNVSNGVLYKIDDTKLLNAILFKLLSYNISIYVTDNSGDYIISINQ